MRNHVHGLCIDNGDRVDAGFGHVEAPRVHDHFAGHHTPQRPTLRILEARPRKRRERRLPEYARAIFIDLCYRVLMRERDVDRIIVAGHAGRRGASHRVPRLFRDLRAQAQLRRWPDVRRSLKSVGPQRTAPPDSPAFSSPSPLIRLPSAVTPSRASLDGYRERRENGRPVWSGSFSLAPGILLYSKRPVLVT